MNTSVSNVLRACLLGLSASALAGQGVVQVETFTVTAQKRVQTVAEVPVALTAYSGTSLEAAGVTEYKELAPLVPGLFIQQQSPNNPGINIRGITTDTGDPRAESRVSIFQDGVSASRSRGAVVELFDLERIEVLKGPQGTLFGRGAEIGAISVVQNKARNETTRELTFGFGDHNEWLASGRFNAPLADSVYGRFSYVYRQYDGLVENFADGSDLNGKKTLALRSALRWLPAERTSVDLIANWQQDDAPGAAFISGVIPNSRGSTSAFGAAELNRGGRLGIDRTVDGLTGIVEHEFTGNVSLTSTTGWREYHSTENFDADGSRLPLLEFGEEARGRQFSQEFRVNFHRRIFTGFAGASWFAESASNRVPFYQDERQLWPFLSGSFRGGLLAGGVPAALVDFASPALNPFVPQAALPLTFAAFNNPGLPASIRGLSALAGAPLAASRTDEYTQSGRTRAFDTFVDGTWRWADRFEFGAGLRLTQERTTSGYEVVNAAAAPTLAFIVYSIPGYPFLPSGGRREVSSTSNSWDGRANLRYEFTKSLSGFASVARGHRPRTVLVDSTTTSPLREEEVTNYEVGLKGTASAGRLQWSASAFKYEYSHFQTTVLSLGKFTLLDAGNATGRGFEAAIQGRAADNLDLFANYAFTDSTFDAADDNGRPQQYAGSSFRLTPRQAVSIGGTFTLRTAGSGQFSVTPVWSYKSKHYFEDDNSQFGYGLKQDAYDTTNLRVGWRSPKGRWEVTAHADNLFDREYLIDGGNTGGSFGIPTYVPGDPRRIGVKSTLRW